MPARQRRVRDADVRDLFLAWQQQRDARAREELSKRFMPLARKLASRYDSANEPLEDLIQIASVGLLLAIDRFDPDAGTAFASFAVPTILGELRRHFRDHGWSAHVPRGAQEAALKVEKAIKEISLSDREPTAVMLAEYLEWPLERVLEGLEARAAHYGASLNTPAGADEDAGVELLDTLGRVDDGYETVDAWLALEQALSGLGSQTREVVRLRWEANLSQAEIGERIGVSQMQVSRLLRAATNALRAQATG